MASLAGCVKDGRSARHPGWGAVGPERGQGDLEDLVDGSLGVKNQTKQCRRDGRSRESYHPDDQSHAHGVCLSTRLYGVRTWGAVTSGARDLSLGAKQGDMVGPVRDGDFIYLFSITGKRESRQLTWDEVAVSASKRAVSYCRQEAATKLENDMFAKYGVALDSAAIGAMFDRKPAK